MTLIDGFRSHHGTLTDELYIIEIAIHVDAVHHQMQVGNATLGVTVKGGEILRVCYVFVFLAETRVSWCPIIYRQVL